MNMCIRGESLNKKTTVNMRSLLPLLSLKAPGRVWVSVFVCLLPYFWDKITFIKIVNVLHFNYINYTIAKLLLCNQHLH